MGSCQSKNALNSDSVKISGAGTCGDRKEQAIGTPVSSTHKVTDDQGRGPDESIGGEVASGNSDQRRDSRWHGKPGLSSGASSDRDESDTGRWSDPLRLNSMRRIMDGDLVQTVVRIETPFGKPIEGRLLSGLTFSFEIVPQAHCSFCYYL